MADWPTAICSATTSPQRPDCASAFETSSQRCSFSKRRYPRRRGCAQWRLSTPPMYVSLCALTRSVSAASSLNANTAFWVGHDPNHAWRHLSLRALNLPGPSKGFLRSKGCGSRRLGQAALELVTLEHSANGTERRDLQSGWHRVACLQASAVDAGDRPMQGHDDQ
jgi:hypothetical protein